MMAMLLIPISGGIALSVELGGWYYVQRSMQNAADSAALAAAINNSTTGSTYLNEARAAAKPYGFVDGEDDVTVNAAVVTCPAGTPAGSTCYEATITSVFPISFSNVLGFTGSQALGSGRGQLISARAVATAAGAGNTTTDICVMALANTGVAFLSNGGPRPDLTGCSIYSNSSMECNGHDLDADYGIAVGGNGPAKQCGNAASSGATPLADPYSSLAANIPANALSSCLGDFPQLEKVKGKWTVEADNQISGSKNWTDKTLCGDIQLTGDVTLTESNTVLIIENGRLDLNGFKLKTATGASATIVFSGDNASASSHYPMSSVAGSAELTIEAPSTGPWKGVAIYQDPNLTNNVSFSEAGNDPVWNISGLAYFPKADIGFSGVVNKDGTVKSCFVLVAYTIVVSGTAQILANTQCDLVGLDTPEAEIPGAIIRERLVL